MAAATPFSHRGEHRPFFISFQAKLIYNIIPTGRGSRKGEGGNMEAMTDFQFVTILEMVSMILDGCKNLEEAREKIKALREDKKEKEKAE